MQVPRGGFCLFFLQRRVDVCEKTKPGARVSRVIPSREVEMLTVGVDDREDIEVVLVNKALHLGRVGIVVEQVVSEILDSLQIKSVRGRK